MKWLFYLLVIIPMKLAAQQQLLWQPLWVGKPIVITEEPTQEDDFQLNQLKWYMSGLTFWAKGIKVWEDSVEARLWEAGNPERMKLTLPQFKLAPDSLSFFLGIDSLAHLQVSLTGDTDPTLGMYWTWQNGYIHLKMEGKLREKGKPARNISLHLGGYRQMPCRYAIGFAIKSASNDFVLHTELSNWIMSAHIYPDQFMQPGPKSVVYSQLWSNYFSLKP